MAPSLRLQLLAWVLTPLALLAGVNAAMGYRTARDTADLVIDRMLVASARAIAEETHSEDGLLQATVPPAALEMFDTGTGDFIYYRVMDGTGHLLAGVADLPLRPRRHGEPIGRSYEEVYRGRSMRFFALVHDLAGPGLDVDVTVVVGSSLNGRNSLVRRLWLAGFGQQMALLVTAGIFMVFGLKRGLAPLLRLRDEVRTRAPTNLDLLEPATVQTEIRPLVAAINQQTARVRAQLAAQHRFVTNAAHQLRTPLTVLNVQATYALRRIGTEEQAAALAAIQVGVAQMSRLAEQLLTLSRAEPGSRRPRDDRVALGVSRLKCWKTTRRKLWWKVSTSGSTSALTPSSSGDETMLGEMVVNLVDNAVRYCPDGSSVTLVVDREGETAILRVQDSGLGVPADEEDRIFERFYRIIGTDGTGSGLGLAIVREVAETAGGTVTARRSEDGGLAVEVRLPSIVDA